MNAVQVYPWSDGALYRLYTAPERVSEIALEPGETLVSVAAGDTVRWVIGDTVSGTGPARRTHVLVKPTAPGLSTNLVISTDRRVYHELLESTAGAAMASVSWSYPEGALLALDRSEAAAASPQTSGAVGLETLNFGYRIDGDDPPWVLIPQGARLIGRYDSSVAFGQRRALLVWQRLVFPDGSSLPLEDMPATDRAGYAGIQDGVDFHTGQLLKGIGLATLLGVGTEIGLGDEEGDLVRALREASQDNAARAGERIVARNLDIEPTLTVRPGWPVRAIVTRDLVLSPWGGSRR